MITNYLKIAWRNLLKNKTFSLINIFGLAMGMAVAMLIGLWVWDELSFNKSFKNYDRIGQAYMFQSFNGHIGSQTAMPIPLANELRQKYDDFEQVALGSWKFEHILGYKENKLMKIGMHVEPQFLTIIMPKILAGSHTPLNEVNNIILSASLAKSVFGTEDPINKIIRIDNKNNLKVSAVFEDFAPNTVFRDLTHFTTWQYYEQDQPWIKESAAEWSSNSFQCFVQLKPNTTFEQINAKTKNLIANNLSPEDAKFRKPYFFIHPMSKWQLYSEFKEGVNVGGRIQFVWLFGIIGIFVLLLACINFMNLSTARSEKRAKEVGIRKAVGSVRSQLIYQFLSESFLTVSLAFLITLILVWASLTWFNNLANKHITMPWDNLYFWIICVGFILITGLLSGSYPALYLSSFNPIRTLKGTFRVGRFASLPRKVLVVVQFTVSVALIIGTIIVYQQIQYAKNRPIGYDKNGILMVQMNTPDLYGKYDVLRNDLLATGMVENMSESSSPLSQVWANNSGYEWTGKDPSADPLFARIFCTHDYGKTAGFQLVAGRDFSREFSTDSAALIMNEAAAKIVGKDALDKEILWKINNNRKYRVIGIIKDMLMDSPYKPVMPAFYYLGYQEDFNVINVKIKPTANASEALAKIEPIFKKYNPNSPFEYKFIDDEFAKKFAIEERVGKLSTFFAVLAIFISCLGLFGLTSFIAEQRTKEIGVRKVLGASVLNITQLLSKDFILLVILSCIIATPIAYYFLSGWLEQYDYRTTISWWIFVVATCGALLITLLTVSYQAIRAALMNPVKSLKTE